MRLRSLLAAALLLPALAAPSSARPAGRAAETAVLPPALPWDGASRSLIAKAGDPWLTPAEAAGFRTTPSCDETVAWLRRLDAASPQVALVSLGKSGPEAMGWRTTAQNLNLNLNRDYAKLDTPEMQHLVAALEAWQPDLYADLHVTDGIDYQYDITWGFPGRHAYSPAIAGRPPTGCRRPGAR